MPKIYKRNCNTCNKYYKNSSQFYCSRECMHNSRDWKDKISKSLIGHKRTLKSRIKQGKSLKGKTAGIKHYNYKGGFPPCEVCNKKLSAYRYKRCRNHRIISEEARKNISERQSGEKNRNYKNGIPKCKDCNISLSYYKGIRCKECYWKWAIGKNNPNWVDGRSLIEYPSKFNKKSFRNKILERDKYICQLCKKTQEEELNYLNGKQGLSIHHINYNKQNCKENNLITLCLRCNNKVNKHRIYWQYYFKFKIWILKITNLH